MYIRQYNPTQGPGYWRAEWASSTREQLQRQNKLGPLFGMLDAMLPAQGRALEVGVGLANWPSLFPRLEWYGVDVEPEVIARDKKELPELAARLHLVNGTMLPFADGFFDVYCNFGVIEHGELEREFIAEALRVLRPGGLAIFTTPYLNPVRTLALPYIFAKQVLFKARGFKFHQKIYTRSHVARYMVAGGFVDVQVKPQGKAHNCHMIMTFGKKPR